MNDLTQSQLDDIHVGIVVRERKTDCKGVVRYIKKYEHFYIYNIMFLDGRLEYVDSRNIDCNYEVLDGLERHPTE